MANKYISQNAGRLTEIEANIASAGAADSGKLVALDTAGKISSTMLRDVENLVMTAGEALTSSDLVYVYDDAGSAKVKKAVADAAGHEADGYVLASPSEGETTVVYFEGKLVTSGLVAGKKYYLSDVTAGDLLAEDDTLPAGTGEIMQYVGKAVSTTELMFEPSVGII